MSPGPLPAVLMWLAPPVVGALLGLAAGGIAARLAWRRTTVQGLIRRLVSTPRFLHEMRQVITARVDSISALPMKELLLRVNARHFLAHQVLPVLAREEARTTIAQAFGSAARDHGQSLITDDLMESISGPLGRQLPLVIERIIEWMESAEMRDTMAARGRELLPKILDQLNVMQRFLLSAGQFDKRLDEKMPEIVEETLQALERILRDPAQQHAMRDKILLAVRDWRDGQTAGIDVALPVTRLVDGYLQGLEKPLVREDAYRVLEELLTRGGQSVGAFLSRHAGVSPDAIADSLANSALAWISRPQTAAAFSARVTGPGRGLSSLVRAQILRVVGIFGLALGLAVGLFQDILLLLWH
jgi:hypothetical protein